MAIIAAMGRPVIAPVDPLAVRTIGIAALARRTTFDRIATPGAPSPCIVTAPMGVMVHIAVAPI